MRSLLSLLLPIILLPGCSLLQKAEPRAAGDGAAAAPAAWSMLAVERMPLPRGLDNDRVVPLMADVFTSARTCGLRLEALEARSDASRLTPGRLAVGGLISGIAFAAAGAASAFIPDPEVRQSYSLGMGIATSSTAGILSGLGVAATANPARGYDRRIGRIEIAFEEFLEDWADVLTHPDHVCRVEGEPTGKWLAPASLEQGALAQSCLVVPDPHTSEGGPGWTPVRAGEHFGVSLDAPRCLLPPAEADALNAALRDVLRQFEGRCTGTADDVDVAAPEDAPTCL